MQISKAIFRHEARGVQRRWVSSKKFVQQGHSPFYAQSVHSVREHGKMARTLLTAFINRPWIENFLGTTQKLQSSKALWQASHWNLFYF